MTENLELLDILTILGFVAQIANAENLAKQATNNEVLADLQRDFTQLNDKLDYIIERLDS